MPLVSLEELPPRGALLGIDPGDGAIGVAACDSARLIASPVEVIARGKRFAPALERLLALYDGRACVGMVIGLPVNMDGSLGPRAQSARTFARNILNTRDIPIAMWDERLSTAAVERMLIDADVSRRRRGEVVDKLAAAWILQGAIDRLAALPRD